MIDSQHLLTGLHLQPASHVLNTACHKVTVQSGCSSDSKKWRNHRNRGKLTAKRERERETGAARGESRKEEEEISLRAERRREKPHTVMQRNS